MEMQRWSAIGGVYLGSDFLHVQTDGGETVRADGDDENNNLDERDPEREVWTSVTNNNPY